MSSKLLYILIVAFSGLYFATIYAFQNISVVFQFLVFAVLVFWFISRKNTWLSYVVILIITSGILTQWLYVLNLLALYMAYVVSKDLNEIFISDVIIKSSLIICLLSVFVFYLFGSYVFDEAVLYPHYFVENLNRLIGLDASPAFVSFSAGFAFLLIYLKNEERDLKVSLVSLFFLLIIFFAAGRTALLGVVISTIFALLNARRFSFVILFFLLFPIFSSLIYIFIDDYEVRTLMELMTSHRVVNWSNLLLFVYDNNLQGFFFGSGKIMAIDYPYFDASETGLMVFVPEVDSESSILKIIIYHGLYSLFFFFLILNRLFVVKRYVTKVLISYLVFASIFYDAIFSIQYIYVAMALFVISRNGVRSIKHL